MASSTLGRRSTWTEGDKAIAAKYPANFHPEIIALRENNIKSRKSRELLKDDIGLLEKQITSLSSELRQMKNSPGPSICARCTVVAMVWKQLSCGHIFCHNCLEQKREARRKKLQAESDEKWGKLQREMISWRKPVIKVTDDICPICEKDQFQ